MYGWKCLEKFARFRESFHSARMMPEGWGGFLGDQVNTLPRWQIIEQTTAPASAPLTSTACRAPQRFCRVSAAADFPQRAAIAMKAASASESAVKETV
ncbi:hypothetical protein BJG93_19245 [Paraburkholderia sprentiae WSM5005]|uniref:Uncharacterized protein n=1 Tax=Paraburkholderia sprentiae WSM5005 TaxID=754502 RepID=A0A1I9YMS8_9BURK|nr:hypothetical protein [Paraburkholderia sprentiae]APA87611.2 hypothetical protein BJG93_19245 [Paraburkholderia sprentiae WSM5005]